VPGSGRSFLKRFARRTLVAAAWLLLLVAATWQAVAWLLPQGLLWDNATYLVAAEVAFFGRTFAFHTGLMLISVLLVAALLKRLRLAAVTVLLVVFLLLPAAWDARPRTPPPAATDDRLRLMTLNLWYLNTDADAVLAAIAHHDPDVLVLQEMASPVRTALRRQLKQSHPHAAYFFANGHSVIFSKTPIHRGRPAADLAGRQGRAAAYLDFAGHEVALFGVHLVSPTREGMIHLNRLESAELAEAVAAERAAGRLVIVAGDHNFIESTPNAAALHAQHLQTTHDLANPGGRGSTWPQKPDWVAHLPGVRIDHIWLDSALTATSHHVGPTAGSDHLPVVADIALRQQAD
jgi:endonuclease/exonuclease/phosphatase (EEP) superfamily protein YafD